ncbi:MAG: hypothetical protein J6W45_09245 [Bacteroidales bacterium]|nr:hypothetical protein [Bacteroidales bacterium]
MRRILATLLCLTMLFAIPTVSAQDNSGNGKGQKKEHRQGRHNKAPKCPKCGKTMTCWRCNNNRDVESEITDFIEDLSDEQREKLHELSKDTKEKMTAFRQQQWKLRDSINTIIRLDGDQSDVLLPLIERRAQLRVAMDMELYRCRLLMRQILTEEQAKVLREKTEAARNNWKEKRVSRKK